MIYRITHNPASLVETTTSERGRASGPPPSSSLAASTRPPSVLRGAKFQGASIDWMRLSGPLTQLHAITAFLSRDFGQPEWGKGRFFLGASWRWGGGMVLAFDPLDKDAAEHCVLEVPGAFLASMTGRERRSLLNAVMTFGFKCTRLDIALDWIGQGIRLIDAIHRSCEAGELTGARSHGYTVQRSSGGQMKAHMATTGQRGKNGSGRYLRCYDKGLEQKTHQPGEWVRWEVEFADHCADQAARLAIGGTWCSEKALIELALGVVDFRQVTGHRSLERRPRVAWWSELLQGVEPVRVTSERRIPNVESWSKWLQRCVGPQLETLAVVLGKDFNAWWREVLGPVALRDGVLKTEVGKQLLDVYGVTRLQAGERLRVKQLTTKGDDASSD